MLCKLLVQCSLTVASPGEKGELRQNGVSYSKELVLWWTPFHKYNYYQTLNPDTDKFVGFFFIRLFLFLVTVQ